MSRNAMLDQVLPFLEGEQAPETNDVLLVSDVDDTPKQSVLLVIRNYGIQRRVKD